MKACPFSNWSFQASQMPAVVVEHGTGQVAPCVLQSHRSVGRSLQHSANDDANKTPSSTGTEFLRCQNDQHLHLHGSCPTQPPFGTREPRPATLLPPWLAPSTGTAALLQKGEVLELIPETFCDQQLTQNSLLWWLLGPLSHWSQIFIPLLAGWPLGSIHYLQHAARWCCESLLAQQFLSLWCPSCPQ